MKWFSRNWSWITFVIYALIGGWMTKMHPSFQPWFLILMALYYIVWSLANKQKTRTKKNK